MFFTGFTVVFIKQFCFGIGLTSPLLVFLALVIVIVGLLVGRREGWSPLDALYWAFITATTIGYGDFRPTERSSRVLAVLIGFLGLILSGIIIALAVAATTKALQSNPHETMPVETQGMAAPRVAIRDGTPDNSDSSKASHPMFYSLPGGVSSGPCLPMSPPKEVCVSFYVVFKPKPFSTPERPNELEQHMPLKGNLPSLENEEIDFIRADGDELEFIRTNFSHIPFLLNQGVVKWYGEMAKFIYNNIR